MWQQDEVPALVKDLVEWFCGASRARLSSLVHVYRMNSLRHETFEEAILQSIVASCKLRDDKEGSIREKVTLSPHPSPLTPHPSPPPSPSPSPSPRCSQVKLRDLVLRLDPSLAEEEGKPLGLADLRGPFSKGQRGRGGRPSGWQWPPWRRNKAS